MRTMKVSWKINLLITTGVTVTAFLACDGLLSFRWWADAAIALTLGGIVNQFFLTDREEDHEIEVIPGLTRKAFKEILASGRDQAARLSELAGRLHASHRETAGDVQEIADVVATLFRNFETDPRDAVSTGAQRLLNDHLPRALRFVEAYVRLATAGKLTAGEKDKLSAMESKVGTIRDSFTRHLEGFRTNDFDALKVEGETLETIYRLDI
jgi:5-bromo-4-chloroindolyl phosphate hydrolysis protein